MDWKCGFDNCQTSISGGTPSRTGAGLRSMTAALLVGLCQPSFAQTDSPLEKLPASTSRNAPAPNEGLLPAQRSTVQSERVLDDVGLPRVVDHQNLNDIIRDTSASRRRTTALFNAHDPHISPTDTPNEYRRRSGELRDRMSQSGDDHATTYHRLDKKLDQLEDILKNNPVCQPQPAATDLQPSPLAPPQDVLPRRDDTTSKTDSLSQPEPRQTFPTLQVTPETPSEKAEPIVDAIAVTNEPVDQMSLANNLYATREYEIALQIYEKINMESLSNRDAIWVRYQIANCQQRLGNQVAAQRGFRQVTVAADGGWWSKHAHWRLDTNDKTTRLRERLDQLELKLSVLKGVSNDKAQ